MVTVNAMGDICPIPVVKTKKAIDALTGPDQIEVLVDNETAMRNVMKLAKSSGASAEQEQLAEREYRVLINVGENVVKNSVPAAAGGTENAQSCPACIGTVAAIGSDRMGGGSDELGRILMKSFIFAVTQMDALPDKMVFYNGGAKLTIEGSECLDDPGRAGRGDHDLRHMPGLLWDQG